VKSPHPGFLLINQISAKIMINPNNKISNGKYSDILEDVLVKILQSYLLNYECPG
jgi:hypothetical protein